MKNFFENVRYASKGSPLCQRVRVCLPRDIWLASSLRPRLKKNSLKEARNEFRNRPDRSKTSVAASFDDRLDRLRTIFHFPFSVARTNHRRFGKTKEKNRSTVECVIRKERLDTDSTRPNLGVRVPDLPYRKPYLTSETTRRIKRESLY